MGLSKEIKAAGKKLEMMLMKADNNQNDIKNSESAPVVFISHSTTDKEIADMLITFLKGIGLKQESIFSTSVSGSAVKEVIPKEIKDSFRNSVVNIAVLSDAYYKSTYCLNEAGIIWYSEARKVLIGLPEITKENMQGFLDSSFFLRRLDSSTDISYISEIVTEKMNLDVCNKTVFNREQEMLKKNYKKFISQRKP